MINQKNTYFKSEIIKNLENLKFNEKITPVVYLKTDAVRYTKTLFGCSYLRTCKRDNGGHL